MIDALPGFREFYPEDCFIRNFIFEKMRRMCRCFRFEEYDAPTLEPLELYTEKSGEEIVNQLFHFVDRGGRTVALRPEGTPAVARMIGSKINSLKRPLKWFSIAEYFRYERPQKGRLRSFYQLNIDIFDEPNLTADAEIIALTIAILQSFGLSSADFHVRLSHRSLWAILLQALNIPQENHNEVLAIIDKIERMEPREMIQRLDALTANEAFDGAPFEKRTDGTSPKMGTDEAFPKTKIDGPSPKMEIDGALFRGKIDGASFLEKIQAFRRIRSLEDLEQFFIQLSITNQELLDEMHSQLSQMQQLVDLLGNMGLRDFITIDFSIVRGLAYYTGFVFECFERSGKSRALAGGGRYDHLIGKMGYPKTTATGLAIGDVTLTNILQEKNLLPSYFSKATLWIIFDESSRAMAMHDAYQLRQMGYSVAFTLKKNVSLEKQFNQALPQARWIATYQDGKPSVTLRDVVHRIESEIARNDFIVSFKKQEKLSS